MPEYALPADLTITRAEDLFDTATGPVSFASIDGIGYMARPDGIVERWEWAENTGALTRTPLADPRETGRQYRPKKRKAPRKVVTGNITTDTYDLGDLKTTNSSWAEDIGSDPFSDIHDPIDTTTPDVDRRPRFPRSNLLWTLDLGGVEYMFAARGNVLRWSHPFGFLDSLYYGYSSGETGDPGNDWPNITIYETSVTGGEEEDQTPVHKQVSSNRHPRFREKVDSQLRSYGPEDWSQTSYVDLAQGDDDEITALAHYQDHILVFKNRSIWLLIGNLPDAINVQVASQHLGATNAQSVQVTDRGVFFYSHPEGLHLWDGEKIVDLSSQLDDPRTPLAGSATLDKHGSSVSYYDNRIILSRPEPEGSLWIDTTTEQQVEAPPSYVLDLRTPPSWVMWSMPIAWSQLLDLPGRLPLVLYQTQHFGDIPASLVVRDDHDPTGEIQDEIGGHTLAPKPLLRVGPVRPQQPDMAAAWRRTRLEIAAHLTLDPVDFSVTMIADSVPQQQRILTVPTSQQRVMLETPILGRATTVAADISWTDRAVQLTGVVFCWWPGRRTLK